MPPPPARRVTVTTYEEREAWIADVLARPTPDKDAPSPYQLTAGAKLTAIALAQHLNFKSGRLDPSLERQAKLTAQTVGAIPKHHTMLKKAGLIEWVSTRGRVSNKYLLTFPTLSERSGIADTNPCPLTKVESYSTHAHQPGFEANPIQPALPTLSEGTAQPYPGVETNLVLNHEVNLYAEFSELRREIGPERWHEHIWEGATIMPPGTILFRSPQHLHYALKHYRADFERLGYQATSRKAA